VPKDPKEARKQATAKRRRKQVIRRGTYPAVSLYYPRLTLHPTGQAGSDASDDSEVDSSDEDNIDVEIEMEGGDPKLIEIDGHEYIVKNFQGDPTDAADYNFLKDCVSRWKANAADIKKGMLACFDESGSFIGVCRHGILLVACDMVQSGEL
jgi:hypothetical protein